MKIRPVGAELFQGQTDRRDDAKIRFFQNFGNAPKIIEFLSQKIPPSIQTSIY